MTAAELAALLADAAAEQRSTLLAEHAGRAGLELAWALKELCYAEWTSQPLRAAGAAQALAELAELHPDGLILALAGWCAGIAALIEGQMETALCRFDAAVTRFEQLERPLDAAAVHVPRLLALAVLGRYEQAIETGLRARDIFLAHQDQLAAGKIEQNLGNIYWRRDRYAEAEQIYQSARERFLALNDTRQLAQVENGLANVLAQQYRFDAAASLYEQALARTHAAGLTVTQAEIECNLGCLALFQGRYDRALDYLERSRRGYAALGMEHESAYAELELAEAYLELNLAPEAASIYARISPTFAALGMQAEQARASANHARACLALGHSAQAQALLEQARRLYASEHNLIGDATVQLTSAQLDYAAGHYLRAAQAAAHVEPLFAAAAARGRALLARWLRGEALRAAGDLRRARPLLQSALRAARRQALPHVAQRCRASLGFLAMAAGKRRDARRRLLAAIRTTEALRAPLPAEEFRTAFIADKQRAYVELVRLSLDEAGPEYETAALRYVERSRSQALLELLGGTLPLERRPRDPYEAEQVARIADLRAELNWFYSQINRPAEGQAVRPAEQLDAWYAAAGQREHELLELQRRLSQRDDTVLARVKPLDLHALQAQLGQDTLLIEYYALDDELLVFVLSNEHISVRRQLASLAETEALIGQLRFQLDALRYGTQRLRPHLAQLTRRVQHYLARLYDRLIRPIQELAGQRRLAIVPHRALHYLPFQALYDGQRYLIETHELCYAPSAGVLQHCLQQPARRLERALLLGVADERIPRVHDEISTLAPLFAHSSVLRDAQASTAALRAHATQADLLHLACHGRFRPDSPLFSALRLGDGWLTLRDAYELELSSSLVTLSACETGVSQIAPGDELLGLARGFLSAGASRLLVSLWTVDDASTAELMASFYRQLQQGSSAASALAYAQRELLDQGLHPFFWAPFILLGRW